MIEWSATVIYIRITQVRYFKTLKKIGIIS